MLFSAFVSFAMRFLFPVVAFVGSQIYVYRNIINIHTKILCILNKEEKKEINETTKRKTVSLMLAILHA